MKTTGKIRVAVLFGGRSTEHEVSVNSAANVIQNLDRSLFEVIPIKIDKQGTWFLEGPSGAVPQLSAPPEAQQLFAPVWLNEPQAVQKAGLRELAQSFKSDRLFDVIFPIMHGTFSEDGTIQGLLELADVPYVGCGVLASSVGMDKDIARRLVNYAGLASVPYLALKRIDWLQNAAALEEELLRSFTLPLFVKPANQGSSIGVTKVKKREELAKAIEFAFRYDTKILVEQGIPATELEIALLESLDASEDPFASQVGEVRPKDEFYSYQAKYTEGGSDFLIPAEIPQAVQDQLRALSKEIFKILCAEGMARIDFFMDKNTQQLYFNEINTIPGFTPTSMYPRMITESGVDYPELLTRLVMLAMKRYEEKQGLERNYQA
jgi:D-alanine-D-alanine ligase